MTTTTVTITCKISGIEFQADSRRTQKHPIVTAMESACMKREWREFKAGCEAVRKDGGYTTAEEFCKLVRAHIDGVYRAQTESFRAAKAAEDADNAARKLARQQQLDSLHAAGFTSRREQVNVNVHAWSMDEEDLRWVTVWVAPNGETMDEARALEMVKRGIETVRAEEAAKAQAEAEAKAAQQTAERTETNRRVTAATAFDAEVAKLTVGMVEVNRSYDLNMTPSTEVYRNGRDSIDTLIYQGQLMVKVSRGNGTFDGEVYTSYFVAGTKPKTKVTVETATNTQLFEALLTDTDLGKEAHAAGYRVEYGKTDLTCFTPQRPPNHALAAKIVDVDDDNHRYVWMVKNS